MMKKPIAVDLNPKAVTNNELYGIINPATREWRDGRIDFSASVSKQFIIMLSL